jgi:hypothetical protein
VSPIHRQALEIAGTVLARQRGLGALSQRERREVETLATAVALRVADALERLDSYDTPASAPPTAFDA